MPCDEQGLVSVDGVGDADAHAREVGDGRRQVDEVIETCGLTVLRMGLDDGQVIALLLHLAVGQAQGIEQPYAGDLKPGEIMAMIHDAHGICFRIAHAQFRSVDEHGQSLAGPGPGDNLFPSRHNRKGPRVCSCRKLGFGQHCVPFVKNDVIEVAVKGVMPTDNGCAIFLGNDDKTFVIYVDQAIGTAISMTINEVKKQRPLTHDLIGSMFLGLGITLERVVICDVEEGTFFARIILRMENELGVKLVEIDARPSDSMVLALQAKRPIFVALKVMDSVEDMSEILAKILKQQG